MIKNFTFVLLFLFTQTTLMAQEPARITGRVTSQGASLVFATVSLNGSQKSTKTNENGFFEFRNVKEGVYELRVSLVGFEPQIRSVKIHPGDDLKFSFELREKTSNLDEVEIFGERNKQPEKLDVITRLPLKPSDQIQSISVVSSRLIEQQGALTISDAARNVPGVYTFATYGGVRESMSSRGYRGIPVLKNGIRTNSDFRGTGVLTDMQGIESIQVLKGAAAITQGVATDIGSPGGIINLVTKTPKFENSGSASLRVGSWGQVRPAFDVQGVVNEAQTVAFRLNGVYERSDSYRPVRSLNKIYVNPSLEWRPDSKTSLTLEMDHLNDDRTPDLGTVNLASNDINAIYHLPYDRYLGFTNDITTTKNTTYTARLKRELNNKLTLRTTYIRSDLFVDNSGASLGTVRGDYTKRTRSVSGSTRDDQNSILQLDLIGQDVHTGPFKHTFQVGVDFRTNSLTTSNTKDIAIDTIDVTAPVNNKLVTTKPFENDVLVTAHETYYGALAQDVISYSNWLKLVLGVRYSYAQTKGSEKIGVTTGGAWNPQIGLMLSPRENINVFGSYTSSTSLRSAANIDVNGNPIGNSRSDQFEAGVKSDWLNNRLRFNLTLYKINNKNLAMVVYDENWNPTPFYEKGGNDERKGIEVELTGRILSNLEVIAGYSYIDAKYKDHTSYYYNSAPLNTPKHTYNLYANYQVKNGDLKGLAIGGGVYYVGKRPMNDWARTVTHEGIVPGQKPFDIKSLTTVNAQVSYNFTSKLGARVLFNNIFDKIGYNAYRTSWINQTDPRSFAGVLTYRW
ncbi:TonB-dependent siderophore receptor [Arcticibacter sp.]|uniref:TonB-dependent siderophore receptor n=1 Tax=Arcticibacter sp. TaxID=1872630 RepID=UPI00388ED84C